MKIEDYFVSDRFYSLLMPLYGKVDKNNICNVIQFIMSRVIQFASINDFSMEGVEDYTIKLINKFKENPNVNFKFANSDIINYAEGLAYEAVLNKLGFSENDLSDPVLEKEFCMFCIDRLRFHETWYHSFNEVFYNSILENGINPNINFTSQRDLDRINDLFEKHGCSMVLGWQKLNCVNQVSYALSPSVCYSYGIASPEWFSEFCGGGLCFHGNENRVQYAFRDNDYDGAKNNLLELMKRYNFTFEERCEVLEFFNKNWKLYANRDYLLAAIPRINSSIDKNVIYKRMMEFKSTPRQIFEVSYCDRNVDEHTSEVIDVKDAKFIKLPNYSKIEKLLSYDNVAGKLDILKNSAIGVKEENGKVVLYSMHSDAELEKVKEILCDDEVFNHILNMKNIGDYSFDSWLPYFSATVMNKDSNIVNLYQKKHMYFSYVSESKRNSPSLMKDCISGEYVDKYIMHYVGEDVLNDIEFISLLLVKLKDEDFDFYAETEYSIEGSRMGYGKLLGRKVQTDPKFWEILNSKIKLFNKKYGLNIELFDINREIVIASRYFDGKKEKN